MISTAARDLAADSPLSYEQLAELHRAGTLGARLAAMTSRERIGAATVVAERTGKDVTAVLARFHRMVEGAAPAPTPTPAPASTPRAPRSVVASESQPGLHYLVADNGEACTCPGFRFRGDCKHARRTRETWRARVRALLSTRAPLTSRPAVIAA